MKTAINAIEPRPFYYEAREYCERHDIDTIEECEQVRLSMCVREFRRRMEPWYASIARLAGYGLPVPADATDNLRKLAEQTAKDLGLSLEDTP